jgi:ribosomal protein L37AE/L43A
MKVENERQLHICPKCGKPYSGHPALSRTDNETHICPDCGTREALESIGVSENEQNDILATIHRHTEGR